MKRISLPNRFVVARWAALTLYAVLGLIAGLSVLVLKTDRAIDGALERQPFQTWLGILAVTSAPAFLAVATLFQIAPFRIKHFRAWKYPPIWVAVGLALLLLPTASHWLPQPADYSANDWLLGCAWLLVIATVLRACEALFKYLHSPPMAFMVGGDAMLLGENPINRPEQDTLSVDAIAIRIANGLQRSQSFSVGLIGNYGSGKTSLARLIEFHGTHQTDVSEHPRLLFSHTTCWGFADSKSAIQQILEDAIHELDNHVDTVAVKSLPATYVEAVSASTGPFKSLLSLFGTQNSPESRLRSLTPILGALNVRLVIVLEDLDRNESKTFDREEVLAMLQRIKSTPLLSFILTGGHKDGPQGELSFTKLCDHLEPMPSLSEATVSKAIKDFRASALSRFDDIDPGANGERRHASAWNMRAFRGMFSRASDNSVEGWLLNLLRTPRDLKQVFRRTNHLWEILHGEVDFDDLLCISALHVAAPVAVDFIIQNIDDFRAAVSRRERRETTDNSNADVARLDERWERTISSAEFDVEAATGIVAFLMPGLPTSKYLKSHHNIAPQSISTQGPTDYFRRIMTAGFATGEVRDQDALKMIAAARSDDGLIPLAKRMTSDAAFIRKWEQFASRFPDDKRLALASIILDSAGRFARSQTTPEGEAWIAVWRQGQNRQPIPLTDYSEFLWKETQKALSQNMGLANDIYHFWASIQYGLCAWEERKAARDELRQRTHSWAKEELPTLSSMNLVNMICGPSKPNGWELSQFMFPGSGNESESKFTSDADWTWSGPVICNAAAADPARMTAQVVNLIVDHPSGRPTKVMHERVKTMFGERSREIVQWIHDNAHLLTPEDRMDHDAVKEAAAQWLLSGTGPAASSDNANESAA